MPIAADPAPQINGYDKSAARPIDGLRQRCGQRRLPFCPLYRPALLFRPFQKSRPPTSHRSSSGARSFASRAASIMYRTVTVAARPPQLLVPLGDRALPIRFVAIPRPKPDEQCAASWPGHHSSSAHARSSEERPVIAKHHRPFFDKRQYALHPLLCVGGVVATSFVFPVLLRDYRDGVWKTARLSMLTACRYEMGRHRGKLSIPKTPPCRGAPRPFFAFVPNSGRTETGSLPGFASPCVDAQG